MENIEEKTAQTTDTSVNTEIVGASEVADTSKDNEMEFTDGDASNNGTGESSENENKADKKQAEHKDDTKTQKSNADYARERRKLEQEKALKKAKYDAIIDTLNGVNPYTNEKMEDETDVDEYLTMKEIEKSGKDPVGDYSKFIKAKNKEQIRQQEESSNQKEWIVKDREDFASKHPDVSLDNLIDDDLFKTFALGKVGKMSMDKIYTDYKTFITKLEEQARDRASQILANSAATPGKLSNETPPVTKSYSEMSSAELEKVIERVKRGEIIK